MSKVPKLLWTVLVLPADLLRQNNPLMLCSENVYASTRDKGAPPCLSLKAPLRGCFVFKISPRCHLLTFKMTECDDERSFICPHKQYYPRAHCLPETAVSYCHYKAIFLLLSDRTAATKLKMFSFHYVMYDSAPNCFLKSWRIKTSPVPPGFL